MAFKSFRGHSPQRHRYRSFIRSGESRADGRENDPRRTLWFHRVLSLLADNATAATSGLVLRLICVGPRSGHPALLLQRHVFPGRKRSYGEMHDGGRRGFRRCVRRELELCVNTVIRHLGRSGAHTTEINKRDIRASVSSSWRILPKYRMRKKEGAGGRSSCQSDNERE